MSEHTSLRNDARQRVWSDLSEAEQERVKRLLTIDPDDNVDDVIARADRAVQIIRGALCGLDMPPAGDGKYCPCELPPGHDGPHQHGSWRWPQGATDSGAIWKVKRRG